MRLSYLVLVLASLLAIGCDAFRVTQPAGLFPEHDGIPPLMPSLWEPAAPETPDGELEIVLVEPFTLDNCAPTNAPADVAGKVMIFPSTPGFGNTVTFCTNSAKSTIAEALGASAVLFMDATSNTGFPGPAFSFPIVHEGTIPSWSIERRSAQQIVDLVQAGTTVRAEVFQSAIHEDDLAAIRGVYEDSNGPTWTYLLPGVMDVTWHLFQSTEAGTRPATDPCRNRWPIMSCAPDGRVMTWGALGVPHRAPFPPTFLDLPYIARFTLADGGIIGELPSDIGTRWPNIRTFIMSSNFLSGSIPESFSEATMLLEFNVANNVLSGDTLGPILEELSELVVLDVETNQLSGNVPTSWPQNLVTINLGGNSFSGSLSNDLSSIGASLTVLDLSNNALSGTIPDLSPLTSLTELRMTGNDFTGDFPPGVTGMTSLRVLDLSGNGLTGDLSLVSLSALTTCTELYLNDNDFTGVIPSAMPPAVRVMDLSGNRFSAFSSLAGLASLRRLFLSNNELLMDFFTVTQALPSSADPTSGVEIIDLSNNMIWANSTAPFVLIFSTRFAALTRLILSNNELRGTFLWEASAPENGLLENLVLRDNPGLVGPLPPVFGDHKNLREVDIRGTGMTHLSFGAENVPTELDISNAVHPFIVESGAVEIIDSLNIICPNLAFSVSGADFSVDPQYHNYALCHCTVGFRRREDETGRPVCIKCPDHVECPGFENDASFIVEPGFYPTPSVDDPQAVVQCADSIFGDTACNPDGATPFECKEGHTDRLCAACEADFFRRGSDCLECRPVGILLATGGSILIAAIVLILLLRLRPSNRAVQRAVERMKTKRRDGQLGLRPSDSDLTSSGTEFVAIGGRAHTYVSNKPMRLLTLALISITYVQLVTLAQVDLTLPVTLAALDAIYDIFNMTLRSFGWDCVASSLTIEEQYGVILLMPLLLCAFVGTVSAIYASLIRDAIRRRVTLNMGMGACLLVLNLFYFPMSRQTLATVRCSADPVTDETFFDTDPHIACDEISGGFKAVSIVFYPAGVLLLLALLIARDRKKLNHPYVRLRVGFLCHGFFDDYWYVPIVLLARRTVLAVVISLIKPGSGLRPLFIVVVLNMTLFFILLVRPYRNVFANMLDTLCSVAIVIIYTGSLALSNDSLEDHRGGVETVTFAVHVLTLLTILFFLVWRLRYSIVTWRADRIAKSRDADVEKRLQDAPGGAAGRGLDAEAAHGLEMEMGTVAWSEDTSSSRERSAKSDDSRQFSAEFSGLAGSSSASSASTGSTSSTNASSSSSS